MTLSFWSKTKSFGVQIYALNYYFLTYLQYLASGAHIKFVFATNDGAELCLVSYILYQYKQAHLMMH